MKTWDISESAPEWKILAETPRTQAALMTIEAGGTVGDADHRHPTTDQWLYVLDGHGEAIIDEKMVPLAPGTLLLIEAGNAHTIKAAHNEQLRTVNFYGPPTTF